uniref:Pectinesterase inhibitor domain-containing protein n=1 Tax=Davidia involucrata TaxID=16924 RepID=A0A5B7BM76_DAVIN
MGFRNNFSISLLFLATVALFLAGGAEARFRGINPFCRAADYKLLCNAMVKGATNLDEATENAIRSTLNVAQYLLSSIDLIKSAVADLEPVTRDSLMDTCHSNFEDFVDELTGALEDLKGKDKGSLMTKLSACTLSDCTDSFDQFGALFPLTKVTNALRRYLSNTAAVVQQTRGE